MDTFQSVKILAEKGYFLRKEEGVTQITFFGGGVQGSFEKVPPATEFTKMDEGWGWERAVFIEFFKPLYGRVQGL